jgi:predicted glutamine amidotransferase
MCELNFANLKDKDLNSIYYMFQTWRNGVLNKDGFGFLADDYLLKTEIAANNCTNIGDLLRKNYQTNNPILSHTRLASVGVNNKKVIADDTSHPFKGKYFILAHNGVLEQKKPNDKYKDYEVDTLVFLEELELHYEKHKDIPKAIKESIELFYGTFAFLIYHLETQKFYAVRGRTKKLHISYATSEFNGVKSEQGYVINTDKNDIYDAFMKANNIFQYLYGINVEHDEPKELKENTIFLLEDKPIEVGKVVETYRPVAVRQDYDYEYRFNNTDLIDRKLLSPCLRFITDTGVDLAEFDHIVYYIMGKPLLSLYEFEVKDLIEQLKKLQAFHTKQKYEIWKSIIKEAFKNSDSKVFFSFVPYVRTGIAFPYFVSSKKELEKALEKLKNENINPL